MPVSVSYISNILFSISNDALDFSKLPANKLEKAKDSKREKIFQGLLGEKEGKEKLKDFLAKHTDKEDLGKFLFGDDFKLTPAKVSDETIKQKFNDLQQKYGYQVNLEDFKSATKAVLYTADVIENNNNGDEVYERAYKIIALFKDLKTFDKFANEHHNNTPNPVHDLLQFTLPNAQNLNLEMWHKIVMQMGKAALDGFANANRIPNIPTDRAGLELALSQLTYARASENPEFAKLCNIYKVTQNTFNRTLDLINDGTIKLKTADNIPSVVVKAEDVDASAKGVYLVKLPAGDLRGAILGDITDCCQSIASHSEKCAIDGLTRQNNGFYVLIKASNQSFDINKIDWKNLEANAKIVGQGYVWRSQSGNIVMDSWEGLGTTYDWLMPKLLPKFAEQLHESDSRINSLNIGMGGKTPDDLITKKVPAEGMHEGYMYGDARQQSGIWISPELKQVREELAVKTGIKVQSRNYNLVEAKKLLKLSDAQLKNFTKENYKVLTMPINIEWTVLNIDQVPNLEKELFSNDAIKAYQTGKVTLSDLKDLDIEKIKLLTDYDAIRAYETGKVTASDLKDLDVEKFNLLTSLNAIGAYKTGKVNFNDLKDLDVKKINLLVSWPAIASYQIKEVTFNDLKNLDFEKFELLTSNNALEAYNTGKVTFNDLKDLANDKIELLTSHNAIEVYKIVKVTFNDLKDLDVKKFTLLTSDNAIEAYRTDKVTFNDLKNLDFEKFELLTSHNAIEVYKIVKVTVNDLKDLDFEKFEPLTSYNTILAYKTGKVTFNDLKNLDVEKIKLLTDYDAIRAYETGKVTVNDLKDLETIDCWRKIAKEVISHEFPTIDSRGIDSVDNVEKIKLFTSYDAVQAYRTNKVTVNDLINLDFEKFKLLTSYNAVDAYKTGRVTANDLKDLDVGKIKLLISGNALEVYKTGRVTVNDLKDLDVEKIKLLTSGNAILAYKTDKVTVNDLKDLDIEKIKLLTKYDAIRAYKTGKVTVNDLKDFSADGISKILESDKAAFKEIISDVKKELSHADKIVAERLLASKDLSIGK